MGLPVHAQRLLAYLALASVDGHSCSRDTLAGQLWAESSTARAFASLRTALWRIRSVDPALVFAGQGRLGIPESVVIDVRDERQQATRLLSAAADLPPADLDSSTLLGELLPGWDDDWLLLERERHRQLQLHALEALAERMRSLQRYQQAIDIALRAIELEPLRETAHAVLIDSCLDEGNVASAVEYLRQYSSTLWDELGLLPSARLSAKVPTPQRAARL